MSIPRSRYGTSQVRARNVAGLRFWRHMRRKSATGEKSVAGPANYADLRRKSLGPATQKGWTRDADGLEGEPYSNLDLGAGGA